jgi:WD repeat-containing protein 70
MWDFLTITNSLRPYKDFKPFDGYPVTALSWAPSGDHFLSCNASNQAKIFTLDGVKKQTTIRGDMYLHDMNNTRGHVASVLDGKWHPRNE